MDPKKLEKFRHMLLDLREQILNRAKSLNPESLRLSTDDLADETDHANAVAAQGVYLNVQERERWMLKEINHALEKIEEGTYGYCEDTEEPIDEARLEAQPYTRYSVMAAEIREKKSRRYA